MNIHSRLFQQSVVRFRVVDSDSSLLASSSWFMVIGGSLFVLHLLFCMDIRLRLVLITSIIEKYASTHTYMYMFHCV